jgi:lipooligosaccharide transport system permease protein
MSTFSNISTRSLRVWRRDFEVFRATLWVNFIPPMLEPVLYILAFGFGMGSLVQTVQWHGREVRYLAYVVPGIIAIAVMFQSYFETTYSSFVRMYYQRTFDAMLATPLLVEDVIVGEWLWGASRALMAGAIMLVMVTFFGQVHWPECLWVVPLSLLGGLLFSGLGLITTALVPAIDQFNLSTFLVIFPMFLFSGTFFPLDVLPRWALVIAWALPLTHLSSLLRGACLGARPEMPGWSLLYLGVMTLAATAGAIVLMKRRLVK